MAIRNKKDDKAKSKDLQFVANDPKTTPDKRWITMSNALIRAGHGLTLSEKRLVMLALSKLDSTKPPAGVNPPITKITANEYARDCEVDIDTAYSQLKSASEHLFNRSIMFYEPAHKRNGRPIATPKTIFRWVGRATYFDGDGYVELAWWPETLKHLLGLKKQFTSYQWQQTKAIRSVYSWKLLELLMRFKKTGWAEYTIEDFATSMEATEKQRSDFAAIRRKIIIPAIKELQEKDGWKIEWVPIKTGRKVKAVRFTFTRDQSLSLTAKKAE